MCLTRLAAHCRANLWSALASGAESQLLFEIFPCRRRGCVICVFAAWVIAHYHFMYSFVKRTPTGSERKKTQNKTINKWEEGDREY